MKMTNYRLQTEIENINTDRTEWFKNYVRQVLESNKPYYAKADYIGLSIKELDNKIAYISDDIKELQTLKKNLASAKTTALGATAEVLAEYGIDRLDGTAISSITIAPAKTQTKETFKIIDKDALIQLGFCKVVIDEQAVKDEIKVNPKRNSTNNQASELLTLVENQEAA